MKYLGLSLIQLSNINTLLLSSFFSLSNYTPTIYNTTWNPYINNILHYNNFPIIFTSTDNDLISHNALARTNIDGIFINSPPIITKPFILSLSLPISHEFIHLHQINNTISSGNLLKMCSASKKRIYKNNSFCLPLYFTDKHELSAWARTTIDILLSNNLSKSNIINILKSNKSLHPQNIILPPVYHKKFINYSLKYLHSLL